MESELNNRVVCGGKWISVEDVEEQYGKEREDAAATFNVSVSTFRRKCKKLGINRWPYPKRKSSGQSSSKNNDILKRKAIGTIIPNSIIDHDVVGAQPCLESVSTQPVSSIDNIHLLFKNLIASPLQDLSDPEKETFMKNALSSLADNLSLFSEEEAEHILGLSFDFPALVHNWREWYSRSQTYNLKLLDETERIRDLVENSERDEESLKVRYEELENKEKELMKQLAAVQKEKAEIAEQRIEKCKHTKHLISLAEEKEAHRNKEERLTKIATAKLNNLSDQWAKLQSFFI